ncbi:hypothetical protein B5M09_011172, partial [Aphanomyces astaci]
CLRLLGRDNEDASEAMNDVLAQVATNTETSKNAGNAILYECVSTIMSIQSESGLKVLAINILGRFLLNRDNNIRYVALNTLSKVIAEDAPAVQRHRNTIVDCLKDPDLSIRQRALELIYALVNESNIQAVRTMYAVDRYAPTQRWHIDTLITMLSIAGSILPDEHISSSLIVLIQKNPALHVYVVHKLFWALHEDTAQLALAHVALWCIGEYGHALCASDPPADEETLQGKTRVDEAVVVALITTVRCLLEPQWASIRGDILAPMPLIDMTRVRTRQSQLLAFSAPATSADFDDMPTTASSAPEAPPAPTNLLDLDDIFGTTTPAAASTSAPPAAAAAAAPTIDLLADLFSPAPATTASSAPSAVVPSSASSQLLDIFGGPPPAPIATAVQPPGQHIRVYEKNGLTLDIDLSKPNSSDPSISHILCLFTNASAYQLDNFVFQAAFPKYIRLIMDPPSGSTIPANLGGRVTQLAKIQNTNHGDKPVMMRIKLEFTINGTKIEDMATVNANGSSNCPLYWSGEIFGWMDAYYLTTLSHNLANDRPVVAPLECAWSPIVLDRRGQHPRAIDFRIDNIVVDLFAPALAIQKDYSNTFTLLRVQSTYAISLLYTRRADLETIIPILRSPMASPDSLLTQYCWLDFNKAWETVHTDARQARYRDRYRLNTAVY